MRLYVKGWYLLTKWNRGRRVVPYCSISVNNNLQPLVNLRGSRLYHQIAKCRWLNEVCVPAGCGFTVLAFVLQRQSNTHTFHEYDIKRHWGMMAPCFYVLLTTFVIRHDMEESHPRTTISDGPFYKQRGVRQTRAGHEII